MLRCITGEIMVTGHWGLSGHGRPEAGEASGHGRCGGHGRPEAREAVDYGGRDGHGGRGGHGRRYGHGDGSTRVS